MSKKEGFKYELAELLRKHETFDFDTVPEEIGWPNIQWMLADQYLRDLGWSEYQRTINLSHYVHLVKNSLYAAKEVVEQQGISVYFVKPVNTKLIRVITTDADYKNDLGIASNLDQTRLLLHCRKMVQASLKQISMRHPAMLATHVPGNIKRLTTSIDSAIE